LELFCINVRLSKKGLENKERVAEIVFKYLYNIRDSGPSQDFFDEESEIGQMNFRFADRGKEMDSVIKFAQNMPQFTDSNVDEMIRSRYVT
jgi:secreted Zn-dependent insulinase-like peptidase